MNRCSVHCIELLYYYSSAQILILASIFHLVLVRVWGGCTVKCQHKDNARVHFRISDMSCPTRPQKPFLMCTLRSCPIIELYYESTIVTTQCRLVLGLRMVCYEFWVIGVSCCLRLFVERGQPKLVVMRSFFVSQYICVLCPRSISCTVWREGGRERIGGAFVRQVFIVYLLQGSHWSFVCVCFFLCFPDRSRVTKSFSVFSSNAVAFSIAFGLSQVQRHKCIAFFFVCCSPGYCF